MKTAKEKITTLCKRLKTVTAHATIKLWMRETWHDLTHEDCHAIFNQCMYGHHNDFRHTKSKIKTAFKVSQELAWLWDAIEPKLQTKGCKCWLTHLRTCIIIVLFIVVSFATAIVLWYVEQKGFLNSLFESVSALTTTGITTGITSPNMNNMSEIFLIFNMIVGRFEIIAIVYFFLEISKRKH